MYRADILCLGLCLCLSMAAESSPHSEQDDSEGEDKKTADAESWTKKKQPEPTALPFLKMKHKKYEFDDTTERADLKTHPNEKFFPLIYSQSHVDSMFKIGENWYTWSTEKRTDGSTAINYYICYEEPQKCDEVGWERTESPPKCALEIDWLLAGDRACVNSFGVEPRAVSSCDGADQMKVADLMEACGARIHSTWRFVRTRRRRDDARPDVSALMCDDREECLVDVEYRIHHDRITFTIREQSKGHIFKSALTRDAPPEERTASHKATAAPENSIHTHRTGKGESTKKFPRSHSKAKGAESNRARSDSGYLQTARRKVNKAVTDDISEDISE